MTDIELDNHIRDCGRRVSAAFAAGDRADAEEWRDRMHRAILSRTPEHRASLDVDCAIWFQSAEALEMGKEAL